MLTAKLCMWIRFSNRSALTSNASEQAGGETGKPLLLAMPNDPRGSTLKRATNELVAIAALHNEFAQRSGRGLDRRRLAVRDRSRTEARNHHIGTV